MNLINSKIIILVITTISVHHVHSVDVKSAEEVPCFQIPESKTAPVDMEWMMSVKKFYYVMMNRYDLYVTAGDLLKKDPKELTEDQVYYDSCITWKLRLGEGELFYDVSGFGGHQITYKGKPSTTVPGGADISLDSRGTFGVAYTTLTDNKSFAFTPICFKEENQMAFAVISPYPTLPKKTIKLIQEHAVSLGFKREQITGLRFDSCGKKEKTKNEL